MTQFLKDEFYSSVASISSGVFNITEPYLGRTKNLIRKAVVAISSKCQQKVWWWHAVFNQPEGFWVHMSYELDFSGLCIMWLFFSLIGNCYDFSKSGSHEHK